MSGLYGNGLLSRTAKFEIKPTRNNQYYWLFRASNGEPLCHSEALTSRQAARNAIASLKASAASAPIEEE